MLFSADDSGRDPAVRALIAADASAISMSLPAEEDSLPVARQALRAFAGPAHVHDEGLEDSEIAITEALANAVEHAYSGDGIVELTLRRAAETLSATVRDHGRGLGTELEPGRRTRKAAGGYGIQIIEAIADHVEFKILGDGRGTEIDMTFRLDPGDDGEVPLADHLEAVVRRILAVVAGQHDIAVEPLRRGLDAAAAAARSAAAHLIPPGDAVLAVDRLAGGVELKLGPLTQAGAHAVIGSATHAFDPVRPTDVIRTRAPRDATSGHHVTLRFADSPPVP